MLGFLQWSIRVIRLLPAAGMLLSYFLTVVLGVVLYATPLGPLTLEVAGYSLEPLHFPQSFTGGFWLLLFLPFAIVPPVFYLTVRAGTGLKPWLSNIPEIDKPEFALAVIGLILYLSLAFYKIDVFQLLGTGIDFTTSVEARYLILGGLGIRPLIALHSILWFLAVYASVKALRTKESFWIISAVGTALAVTVMLIMLNMKWPVLLFFVGLLIAGFLFSRRPWLTSVGGGVVLAFAYIAISSFVFRSGVHVVIPDSQTVEKVAKKMDQQALNEPDVVSSGSEPNLSKSEDVNGPPEIEAPRQGGFTLSGAVKSFSSWSTYVLLNPLHRMAFPFMYYYDVFSREGQICGGLFWYRHPPCSPTYLIYSRIFPTDKRFQGRGSSPAAVHVTGFAKGGWVGSILTMVAASILMGLIAILPLRDNAVAGAMFVTGTVAAYHWSQLPFEGPLIYDHGILWSISAVLVLWLIGWFRRRAFLYLQAGHSS